MQVLLEGTSYERVASTLGGERSPRYLAIVEMLEADISAGRIKPGARLLPRGTWPSGLA